VVVGKFDNALRLVAADRSARKLGLMPGLSFADARARVPQMRVADHVPEDDLALLERLADWADRYTPVLALDPPEGLVLEIGGSSHLFGGEARLRDDLALRLARMGLSSRSAIAGTAAAARAIARFGPGGIVAPGGEPRAADGLGVDALEMDGPTTLGLKRAGLTTIGALAERPRKPLAARFGSGLTLKLAAVLGEIDPPLTPRRIPPAFLAEMRFADPIGLLDDISAALMALSQDLCARLERQGQGGRAFEASFFRADGAVRRLTVLSGRPLRRAEPLHQLLMMRIEALADPIDPGFGFDTIHLGALAGNEAPPAQARLDGGEEAEAALADLVDRLAARFGPESVLRLVPGNAHLPERSGGAVPALSDFTGTGSWRAAEPGSPPMRPLFLFSPPQPVEVMAAEVPDGPPRRFRWRRALHEVVASEGPERIAPEWWRDGKDRRTRDYFRIEDATGQRYWLFRYGLYEDHREVRWFIHGVFP
jgi:protein ImuB